jgi:SAM-dependent methyltransferase
VRTTPLLEYASWRGQRRAVSDENGPVSCRTPIISRRRSVKRYSTIIFVSFLGTSCRLAGHWLGVGCGTGRWSILMAPRVERLHLLDASPAALEIAKQNLHSAKNVSFHLDSVANIPLRPRSLDFAFSLGVLHHVPDTQAAIAARPETFSRMTRPNRTNRGIPWHRGAILR